MPSDFTRFFQQAMGASIGPYPYQSTLANNPWPEMLSIPTGMGKTAAVILSWLFKRQALDPETPRRLAYCLPMRVLVEQTAWNAKAWIDNLVKAGAFQEGDRPKVHVLMGGEVDIGFDLTPEASAILVGTQDQLLSRALNRGYAMSRFRWPVHFGLLNNDCLWIVNGHPNGATHGYADSRNVLWSRRFRVFAF